MLTRRALLIHLPAAALASGAVFPAFAADKIVTIGINLPLTGAYGVGIADAFQHQAEKRGIKVLGRDQLNPKEADYTTVLTKIKSLNSDSLYYGGVGQAGVKVVKQSYDILPPTMIKGGGDGLYGAEILKGG